MRSLVDDPLVLGIETSCDETSVALYSQSRSVISHVTFSQITLHQAFGGVVPDIASRSQLEKIHHVTKEVFDSANITIENIDALGVTTHPGLPGSLLIGVSFAKGLALASGKPIISVNHIEGHIFSSYIENRLIPFPHLCLTASGGHTSIHYVSDFGIYELIFYTLDDAAGEAFDKVSKLMGLPYPGGPILEQLAKEVDFEDYFHFPRLKHKNDQFSFSGIKTAVLYTLVKLGAYDLEKKLFLQLDNIDLKRKIASSLLCCVSDVFIQKLASALEKFPNIKAITFAGGVACNSFIKNKILGFAEKKNIRLYVPSRKFCTDNGAMIAFVSHYKAKKNQFESLKIDKK